MAEFLVLRLGDSPQAPANWIAVDSSGARRSPPVIGPLHEARADIGDRSVIVLVSSVDVLTTTVDIPIRGGVKLQAALPYALEEFLADDVDKLHFAAGTRRSSGNVPVSVVDRRRSMAPGCPNCAPPSPSTKYPRLTRPASSIAENTG